MNNDFEKIEDLRQIIIEKLGWGEVKDWSNYDFEQLSQMILKNTKVQLSSVTLKRVFGKVKYDSKPSTHTLNTLAQFIDYSDWRNFLTQTHAPSVKESPTPQPVPTPSNRFKYLYGIIPILILIVVFLGAISINQDDSYRSEDFSFDFLKVGKDLPASVVFRYDAAKASPNSKVEIQQNWDERRRETVKASDSIHTSIYYYPGFYEAKLVVENQVVQERDLFLPSKSWVTTIEQKPTIVDQKPTPIYVPLHKSMNENTLGIAPEFLIAEGFHPQSESTWANYSLVRKFDVFSDDFSFQAQLKNAAMGGVSICQKIEVLLLFEGSAMIIPLAKRGCIADLNLFIPNAMISGKTGDLSMFGVSTEDWVQLGMTSKEEELSISIDDQLVKKVPLSMETKRLIGFRFLFQGTGWVKDVRLNEETIL